MSKKLKISLIIALSAVLLLSAGLVIFFLCFNDDGVKVIKKDNNAVYRVGEKLDAFDFFVKEAGVNYTFEMEIVEQAQTQALVTNVYYLKELGEYKLTCTAEKDEETASDSVSFTVTENMPFALIPSVSRTYDLYEEINVADIIRLASSNAYKYGNNIQVKIKDVDYYEDDYDETADKILLTADQTKFKFDKEGLYVFNFVFYNDGGEINAQMKIYCEEDLSAVPLLTDKNMAFNKNSKIVSFDAVPEATKYKIKVGARFIETESLSTDITSIMPTNDYKYFDIIVIAFNANGDKIAKMIIEEIIINPSSTSFNDHVVVSRNSTVVSAVEGGGSRIVGEATVPAAYSVDAYLASLQKAEAEYLAFTAGYQGGEDFGTGYYVDFVFKGNNMPNVVVLADKINGELTGQSGDKGVIIMNGLSTFNTYSDHVRVYGPNRLNEAYWDSGEAMLFSTGASTEQDKYYLFSQEAQSEAQEDREFKYTVGTFIDADNNVYLDMYLYEKVDGTFKLLKTEDGDDYHITRSLGIKANEVGTKIIAYSPMKGMGETSTFKFSNPYKDASLRPQIIQDNDNIVSSEAVFNTDGSISLREDNCFKSGAKNQAEEICLPQALKNLENGYVGFEDGYQVGDYLKITFTPTVYGETYRGDNMPNVILFSDTLNPGFTNASGKGILITPGIQSCDTVYEKSGYANRMTIYGPNRMEWSDDQNPYSNTSLTNTLRTTDSGIDENYGNIRFTYDANPLLTQWGLYEQTEGSFTYIVGTYLSDTNTVVIDLTVYHLNNAGKVIGVNARTIDTKITTSQLGGENLLLTAANKGGTWDAYTQFKVEFCNSREQAMGDVEVVGNAIIEGDGTVSDTKGSVSLRADNFYTDGANNHGPYVSSYLPYIQNDYVGLNGNYGVGTYLRINFTTTDYSGTLRADNMPNIILFADKLNSGYTSASGNGLLITGGLGACNRGGMTDYNKGLRIHGPNRATGTTVNANALNGNTHCYDVGYEILNQYGLMQQTAGNFTYIVGTYLDTTDNTVVVDLTLYQEVNGVLVACNNVEFDTGINATEFEGRGIVLFGANKSGTWGALTTFDYEVFASKTEAVPATMNVVGLFNASEGVYANENSGNVSLLGGSFANTNLATQIENNKKGFVGLNGNYGVGTYLKINFTTDSYTGARSGDYADNMPNVILFADRLNSGYTSAYGNGLLISGGANGWGAPSNSGSINSMRIFGPNRAVSASAYTGNTGLSGTTISYSTHPLLTQWGLISESEGNFTYIVGTYLDTDNTVVLDLTMYQEIQGVAVACNTLTFDTNLAETAFTGKGIVMFAADKAGTSAAKTNFSYQVFDSKDTATAQMSVVGHFKTTTGGSASSTAGSVSLNAQNFAQSYLDTSSNIDKINNGYVGLNGDYGVGTYLRINFTTYDLKNQGTLRADNMPNVILFADKLNSGYTNASGNGLLITGGIYGYNSITNSSWNNTLRIFGPNRAQSATYTTGQLNGTSHTVASGYGLFTQYGLICETEGDFTYIVGTYLDTDNTVVVDLAMYQEVSGEVVDSKTLTFDTGINATEFDGRGIVLFAPNRNGVYSGDVNSENIFSYAVYGSKAEAVPTRFN